MKSSKMWSKGVTLITSRTKRWTPEQIKANDEIESTMIFSSFDIANGGKDRELVCTLNQSHGEYVKNSNLIQNAPLMYSSLLEVLEVLSSGEINGIQAQLLARVSQVLSKIERK